MAAFPVATQFILQQHENMSGPPDPVGPATDDRLIGCRTVISEISGLLENTASPLGQETLRKAFETLKSHFESRCDILEDARLNRIKVDLEKVRDILSEKARNRETADSNQDQDRSELDASLRNIERNVNENPGHSKSLAERGVTFKEGTHVNYSEFSA
ncbi:hypothetical protein CMEL01_10587 [Colletotrichum melonis]|uniref:Uncharacterized protein n=1 Tax=Colletotrichum melonis TaxID=1209925 RepID=A0AAI9TV20_9PEZI|nr:hypothetical protein CMEL01_10587 [Colletotrichum melonis]